MLRISKMVDYAVVVLAYLAQQTSLRNTSAIAAGTSLPEPSVAQILKSLNKAQLVTSVRGAAGGYKIAHAAEDISVADIIIAMEGPIALTACIDKSGDGCSLSSICAVGDRWGDVNIAIETALDNVSLRDMMAPPETCGQKQSVDDIQIEGHA